MTIKDEQCTLKPEALLLLEENELLRQDIEKYVLSYFKSFCEFQKEYTTDRFEQTRLKHHFNSFAKGDTPVVLWDRVFEDLQTQQTVNIHVIPYIENIEELYTGDDINFIIMPIEYITDTENYKQQQKVKKEEFEKKKQADLRHKRYRRYLRLMKLEEEGRI